MHYRKLRLTFRDGRKSVAVDYYSNRRRVVVGKDFEFEDAPPVKLAMEASDLTFQRLRGKEERRLSAFRGDPSKE